jgi:hypothetical protein
MAPTGSEFVQVGVCYSLAGNSSERLSAVTTPAGATVLKISSFNGTSCLGAPVGAPKPYGNTTTICGTNSDQAYTTVIYSAAVGIATGSIVTYVHASCLR